MKMMLPGAERDLGEVPGGPDLPARVATLLTGGIPLVQGMETAVGQSMESPLLTSCPGQGAADGARGPVCFPRRSTATGIMPPLAHRHDRGRANRTGALPQMLYFASASFTRTTCADPRCRRRSR
ncbi:MAG: hypothetical protein MZV70_19350 [Desulfobacterales bacterium]|nr:hypothetical protein [Desulfobacterales bacterium]